MRTIIILLCIGLVCVLFGGSDAISGDKQAPRQASDEFLKKGTDLLTTNRLSDAIDAFDNAIKIDPANAKALSRKWLAELLIIDRKIRKAKMDGKPDIARQYETRMDELRKTIYSETVDLLNNNKWTEEILAAALEGFDYSLAPDAAEPPLKKQARTELLKNYPLCEAAEMMTGEAIYETLSIPRISIPENAESTWEKDKLDKSIADQKTNITKNIEILEKVLKEYPRNISRNIAWRSMLYLYGSPTYYDGKNYSQNFDLFDKTCDRWLKEEPDNHYVYFCIANLCYTYKHKTEIIEENCSKAMELLKNFKPVYPLEKQMLAVYQIAYRALQGKMFALKGDYDNALKSFEDAYNLDPSQFDLLFQMGQVEEKRGNKDKAKEYYVRCLEKSAHKDAEKSLADVSGKTIDELRAEKAKQTNIPQFTDVTLDAGICNVDKDGNKTYRGEGRVSIGDYNNDGWDDILLNGNVLYRNNGDGSFTNVTMEAGIYAIAYDKDGNQQKVGLPTGGGVWGDYDNDGFLDFYSVAGVGSRDYLFHNNGDGTFKDVTEKAGGVYDDYPSTGAIWVDVNNDGYLDLYVANYEMPGKELANGTPDILWINQRNGTFKKATMKMGFYPRDYTYRCGYGANAADYDNDGTQEIFVSNYRLQPNYLWKPTLGGKFFEEHALQAGVRGIPTVLPGTIYYGHTIGSQWADFNNDGYLDMISCNLAHPRYFEFSNKTMLYINGGPKSGYTFKDVRQYSGIAYEETHSDPAAADFDNDGILDLYMTSVYVGRYSFLYHGTGNFTEPDPSIPYDNQLPEKQYPKIPPMFKDVTWQTGTRVNNGWGCAWFDYDNDGDMDLIVGSGSGLHLFRNDCKNTNNWLKVKLVGYPSNRAAIGAQVSVFGKIPVDASKDPLFKRTPDAELQKDYIIMRHVEGGKGTGTQSSLTQHFGLGETYPKYPMSLLIRWPGGKTEIIHNIQPNKFYIVTETAQQSAPKIEEFVPKDKEKK